jgi:hypothetical protein
MDNKWIWLDMDGTIADFYSVNGWLDDLVAKNTRPYEVAKSIYGVDIILALAELKTKGYHIGVISWGSKNGSDEFLDKVTKAKKQWLYENLFDLVLDKIIVTHYGINKSETCKKYGYGILVDDEQQNRDNWELGDTINANGDILKILKNL